MYGKVNIWKDIFQKELSEKIKGYWAGAAAEPW